MTKYQIILFLLSLNLISSNEGAGAKVAINDNTTNSILKYFAPRINAIITNIKIDDQYFKVKKIKVWLTEINFGISNFSPDLVNVTFNEPDIINIKVNGIKGWGKFKGKFKWSFISNSERVNFDLRDLSVDVDLKLTSKIVNGKILPNSTITKLIVNYDYDFKFHGSLAGILNLVKKPIKKAINKNLDKIIVEQSQAGLKIGLDLIPIYIQINDKKGYALDYSLISTPKVQKKYLLFNSYASFINVKIPETESKKFPLPENVPDYNINGKQIQVYVSDFVINTALYTFYKTGDLSYLIKPEMLPEQLPIKLDTTYLNTIFWGMSDIYGKGKECEMSISVYSNPKVELNDKFAHFYLPSNISINVRGNYSSPAILFTTDIHLEVDFQILETIIITGYINEMKINNTKVLETKVPLVTSELIDGEFYVVFGILKPFLNAFIRNNLTFPVPSVEGIKFTDMTIHRFERYIGVNYNMIFEGMKNVGKELVNCSEGMFTKLNNESGYYYCEFEENKDLKKRKIKKIKVIENLIDKSKKIKNKFNN